MGRKLRFNGEYTNKVDGKGRVSIPANYRRVLEAGDPDWVDGKNPTFYVVYADPTKNCLECFTVVEMDRIFEKIDAMKRGSEKRLVMEHVYSNGSFLTSVDETGRIVLNAKMRAKAGVGDEAYFASKLNAFQIWNPETYDAEQRSVAEAFLAQKPEGFDIAQLLDEDE